MADTTLVNVNNKLPRLYLRLGVLSKTSQSVTQLKQSLNPPTSLQDALEFEKKNADIFAKQKELEAPIRELTTVKTPNTDTTKKPKVTSIKVANLSDDKKAEVTKLRVVLKEFKKQHAAVFAKKKSMRKYRINGDAKERLMIIINQLLKDIVAHGVTSDQPKIFDVFYTNTTYSIFSDTVVYPLVANLIHKKRPTKEPEFDTNGKQIKPVVPYKSAVGPCFAQLENRVTSGGVNMSISDEAKVFIAWLIHDFVDTFAFYVKALVDTANVKSVTTQQIDYALKLMFFHEDPTLVKYNAFIEKINKYARNDNMVASHKPPKKKSDGSTQAQVPTPEVTTPVDATNVVPDKPPPRRRGGRGNLNQQVA